MLALLRRYLKWIFYRYWNAQDTSYSNNYFQFEYHIIWIYQIRLFNAYKTCRHCGRHLIYHYYTLTLTQVTTTLSGIFSSFIYLYIYVNFKCLLSLGTLIVLVFRTLQWRHNGRDSVSNHQPHDCFLNRLFRHRSKKTSKLRVTGLYAGNSPDAGEFHAQMASNAENVSIWWRHHDYSIFTPAIPNTSRIAETSCFPTTIITCKQLDTHAWVLFKIDVLVLKHQETKIHSADSTFSVGLV